MSKCGAIDLTCEDSDSTISYEVLSDSEDQSKPISTDKRKAPSPDIGSSTKTLKSLKDSGHRLVTVAGISKPYNDAKTAVSLKSLLAGSVSYGPIINSVQFNFMFDIDWMLDQYPSDAEGSPILIVHGLRGSDEQFLKLTGSPYPQISFAQAKLDSPYGTHHTKMMFVEHENGLRVIVSTANMVFEDWHQKTQMVWSSPFLPRKSGKAAETRPNNSAFLASLTQYLNAYDLQCLREWTGKFKSFDFSLISDDEVKFVGSVPGRHQGMYLDVFGHMRLRKLLAKHRSKFSKTSTSKVRAICQFSSIGALGDGVEKWVIPEITKSCLACFTDGQESTVTGSRPILIYPTVSDVRSSLEGYDAGRSLPYRRDSAAKQRWLIEYLHCWRSAKVGRSKAMPHVKTYTAVSSDFDRIFYLLITSANLSKAAWGKLEKKNSQLCILSYEAGILLLPPATVGDNELPFWRPEDVILPYDLPPQPYGAGDKPWIADEPQSRRDSKGQTWLV